ncbi:MAG TPA: diacylglycerol kinase family protein [Edaphobacter sp.]|nr:diacylglycerol kinase family protein [Edaphobacter sp.]
MHEQQCATPCSIDSVRRIAMLVNPVFSSWRRRTIPHIRRIFEAEGIDVRLVETPPASSGRRILPELDLDAVIVCGGDGTVFGLLKEIAGTGIPIGICPLGTGNILAQNLGIPRNPVAAAKALLQAQPITVPLAKATFGAPQQESLFAMSAGIGGHAAMMRAAYRYGKHRTGRLAYFAAGFELLATHALEPFELEITTTSGETVIRVSSEMIAVRVSSLNLWRPGGGLQFPFLRLASVEGASRLRLLQASVQALALGAGRRDRMPGPRSAARYEDILRVQARTIPQQRYTRQLSLQADGEILSTLTPDAPVTIEMAGVSSDFLRVID